MLLLPLIGLSQWVQLGNTLENMYYNNPSFSDSFGSSVSLSADGSVMAVGAIVGSGSGSQTTSYAQVYRLVSGEWEQIGQDVLAAPLISTNNLSPRIKHVALSADGTILAVSEVYYQFVYEDLLYHGGRVRLFKNINDEWIQIGDDT